MPPVNAKPVSLLVVIAALLWSSGVEAAPIRVRLIEGNSRGFLVLRSLDGAAIAYGEVSQKPMGKLVECRTLLRFKDGSLYDESATFSQTGVFRLEGYRLVQHGPSYPTLEVSFDRKSGRYKARSRDIEAYSRGGHKSNSICESPWARGIRNQLSHDHSDRPRRSPG